MFIHKEQLEYVLRPEEYACETHQQQELNKLFQPGWHPIGITGEWARDGDFKTVELLGTPLLLRRTDGQIRGYVKSVPIATACSPICPGATATNSPVSITAGNTPTQARSAEYRTVAASAPSIARTPGSKRWQSKPAVSWSLSGCPRWAPA